MMEQIRQLTWEFALENAVNTLPVSLKKLYEIARKNHWDIFSYQQGKALIEQLGVTDYAERLDAFTVIHRDLKIIFYKDKLPYTDKVFAISHEIGHIVLGHTYHGIMGIGETKDKTDVQEAEADLFGCELLAPSCVLKKCGIRKINQLEEMDVISAEKIDAHFAAIKHAIPHGSSVKTQLLNQFSAYIKEFKKGYTLHKRLGIHDKYSALQILALTLIFSLGVSLCAVCYQPVDFTTALSLSHYNASNTQVVVTENGEKYHTNDCRYVKGKDNLQTMTIQDAREAGYEPCEACRPDESLKKAS